jgi:hypothetical protein
MGVLEYWSGGVMGLGRTSILQYSITPLLQLHFAVVAFVETLYMKRGFSFDGGE